MYPNTICGNCPTFNNRLIYKSLTEYGDLQELKNVLSDHLGKVIFGYLMSPISKYVQWEASKDKNAQDYLNQLQPLKLH